MLEIELFPHYILNDTAMEFHCKARGISLIKEVGETKTYYKIDIYSTLPVVQEVKLETSTFGGRL